MVYKYKIIKEANILDKYGQCWVMITGSSSGQGKQFAIQLANKGFDIILIGSKGIYDVEKIIKNNNSTKTICIEKDFRNAMEDNFFNDINDTINNLDGELGILINNIGHRTGWNPYHEMDNKLIKDTIICGTIIQSILTKIVIKYFLKRKHKSAIINVTALCVHSGNLISNHISVPFLSVYEASNAFGFYHSNSIYNEYKNKIDIITLCPGAVITENTKYLQNIPFNVPHHIFVKNSIKQLGNFTGVLYGHWKHEFISEFVKFMPFIKDNILFNVGNKISNEYMNKKKMI
jgi:short-subunit dehydrogenase